jgi:U3 small nucleolar RNA-associated protein 14
MELGSDNENEDGEHFGSDSDGEENIRVGFDPKSKLGKQAQKAQTQAKGIMGLKFMQRAEQNKKELLKE